MCDPNAKCAQMMASTEPRHLRQRPKDSSTFRAQLRCAMPASIPVIGQATFITP